jgi:hypothetical protein
MWPGMIKKPVDDDPGQVVDRIPGKKFWAPGPCVISTAQARLRPCLAGASLIINF